MAWRIAKALVKLKEQINAAAPSRNKASDGSIGDEAHASRDSDHNPWIRSEGRGVVSAIDVTHDPGKGVDGRGLSRNLISDIRVKYVIFAGEIWKARTGVWEEYRGPNRHDHHVHVSVKEDAHFYDNASPWSIPSVGSIAEKQRPLLALGAVGAEVRDLQTLLRAAGYRPAVDGVFGKITESELKRFQKATGLPEDGKAGPSTWAKLEAAPR